MSSTPEINQIIYLQERVTFLEETNRRHMAILDMLASSGDFQGELSRATDACGIFRATVAQVRRLIDCHSAGCLESLDDGTFELLAVEPDGSSVQLQSAIDARIMDGSFAWALNRNQAVLIPVEDDRTCLMQVIATRSRIRGMFVAILPGGSASVDTAALNALTIILYNCAYSEESAALYSLLREHTSHLEERVLLRTAELEESRLVAESANSAKSEFLANMSHEIRTPMNAIMGLTELILGGGIEPSRQVEYLRMIQGSSENLLAIINDLLDISKIESGKMELNVSPFSLRVSVSKLLQPLVVKAALKDLRVVLSVDENVPEHVSGDEGKLRQILINLVGNALKFSNAGDVTVAISREQHNGDELYLLFRVSDNGVGIPEEVQLRIFDAFEQADSSTSKQFGGTGLGLAISRRLVTLMGGDIGVESVPNEGSTFWFRCRFTLAEQSADHETCSIQEEVQGQETSVRRSLSVLLADDVEFNRILATALLERAGHRVVSAGNGGEALELFAQNHFDVIFMDVQMPVMDGLQATEAIRLAENSNGSTHTPIIALTAYASESDRIRCRQAGMDDYLSKPFKAADMLAVLARNCGVLSAPDEKPSQTETVVEDTFVAEELPVFNCDDLLARLGGRRETIPRFLELYRKGVIQQREDLSAAASSGEANSVRVAAHAIKGAAINIAASRVFDIASRIENLAREGQFDSAVALISDLNGELDRFESCSRELFP
jgi:signal transduction histidine kinase/CheY-like chemotaxis protein/HPt (histidine-containing phosphotransfer) domain-containing protein